LLALVAEGDLVSSSTLRASGLTYRAVARGLEGVPAEESAGTTPPADPAVDEILAVNAARQRPGLLRRVLRPVLFPTGAQQPDLPKTPSPPWSEEARAVMRRAYRVARAAGRRRPCRGDVAVALLSGDGRACGEVLDALGVARGEVGRDLEAAAPGPAGDFDSDLSSIGHILRYALRFGHTEVPLDPDSPVWRMGLLNAVGSKAAGLFLEFGSDGSPAAPALLGLAAAYEDLRKEDRELTEGWQDCFPVGHALTAGSADQSQVRELFREYLRENGSAPRAVADPLDIHMRTFSFGREGFAEASVLQGGKPKRHLTHTSETLLLAALRDPGDEVLRLLELMRVNPDQLRSIALANL
jgi:hypothetical protein